MIIDQLELSNYRNYDSLKVQFGPSVNIIYGENAQGKTNLIEAIYMCATSKSHRLSKEKEIIRLGKEESTIHLSFEKDMVNETIDMGLSHKNTKKIAINKQPIRKLSELFGLLHVIMFSPEDLSLIKSGPKERRRFIDMELSQLNAMYMYYLGQYHKVLKQRNQLLKNSSDKDQTIALLDVFDEQMVTYGTKVMGLRDEFIEELNQIYSKKHWHLSGEREQVQLKYDRNCDVKGYEDQLIKRRDSDFRMKTTTLGPHRDDLRFDMEGIDLRVFGSQGQQRTAALALKLSEIELVKEKIKDTPVLLLDDVLSELDHLRQAYLISHLEEVQTFITCTGVEDFIKGQTGDYRLYHVKDAKVIPQAFGQDRNLQMGMD